MTEDTQRPSSSDAQTVLSILRYSCLVCKIQTWWTPSRGPAIRRDTTQMPPLAVSHPLPPPGSDQKVLHSRTALWGEEFGGFLCGKGLPLTRPHGMVHCEFLRRAVGGGCLLDAQDPPTMRLLTEGLLGPAY